MASFDHRLNPLFTIKECSSCGSLYNKGYCCTPDSSQQPPQDCVKCGNPVEGPNCQGCALWQKKLKEVWFTICHENGIYQDLLNTYESSDDNTNVVNAPQEPFVVKQDPDGNSFTYDSTPNFVNDSPNVFNPPPQPQYVPYSCELCGNDSHYGYDCPPQVPFVYNQDSCFNQNFDYFPQTSPSFPQQYPCCEDYGGPHETFQCQPMNYYEPNPCYDSNYSGFDQFEPPQFPVIHQPIREKTCVELLAEERVANINTQSMQYSIVHQPPQEETSLEFLQDKRNLINYVQTFLRKFNRFSFYETPKVVSLAWETIYEIEHAFEDKQYQPKGILVLFPKLHDDVQNIHEELAEYINTPSWNRPTIYCDDDDDDEDYTIVITPVLSTEEPDNSLSMGDEHLDTILATDSDKVIKSSVENIVQIPSESEGIPDKMCDVPFRDNSPPLNISKDQFEDFSDSNDDSTSINDDSFSIDDIDFVEASPPDSELVSLEGILIRRETFDSDSLREEIDIFPGPDDSIPPGIESDDFDSEDDDNSTSLPEFESFHVDYPDLGDLTNDGVEDILVDVPNILPTHPTLHMDFDFIPSHNDLGSDLDVSSPSGDRNKIYDLGICIEVESTRFLATHFPRD
ncbi:hypothetical protein Tco_0071510 [Tanacetum coccineum]